jgi:hypothetical protein
LTESTAPTPSTLLLHDGELADVRALLACLDEPWLERRGGPRPEDLGQPWLLVIGTPERLLDRAWLGSNPAAQQIAVCDRDSRTLQTSLKRARVGLMVRRPVHPEVLRALLLRALYRGPEKRRAARVAIGAPVIVRAGLRKQSALLADLSAGGCRLLSPRPLEPGKLVKVLVPKEVSGGKAFALRGRVLRRSEQPSGDPAYALSFGTLRAGTCELLRRTIQAHAAGPAKLATPAPATARPAAPADAPAPATVARRAALAEEADHVLVGRDISISGMRVDPSPLLGLGRDVRLAIHAGAGDEPLVVTAKVHRDEGEQGVVLRFHQLSESASHQLHAVIDQLPLLEPSRDGGGIVSKILSGPA